MTLILNLEVDPTGHDHQSDRQRFGQSVQLGEQPNCHSPLPLMLIGSATIIVLRIGWACLIGILVLMLLVPLSNIIS